MDGSRQGVERARNRKGKQNKALAELTRRLIREYRRSRLTALSSHAIVMQLAAHIDGENPRDL